MNERIKELAGLAKIMTEENINRKISKNVELDVFVEKFAELIVRECIAQCNDGDSKYFIAKYFGIKE
jgi:hypothetical protein